MATPRRRTFSGAVVACLLGVTAGFGWVSATASQASATESTLVAPDACPVDWPALRPGPAAGDRRDGNVTVLVGGNVSVTGSAAGAEGVVVVRGDATFARNEPGTYEVGVTATGSQVPPHADSDMLVVGGDLTRDPGTLVEVGRGLRGDVAVGGVVADETGVALDGGRLDVEAPDPLAPYDALLADLAPKSGTYAGRPATGTVEVTETAITLTGDGVSDPQVFAVDGAGLGAAEGGAGRSLQVLGVPDGAAVVVNLNGAVVDLDIDSVLAPGGGSVDPAADAYFAELTTHLLWNVPDASTVDIGGQAQLPGSLLVASSPSTTTLRGAGTNGRVLVAGDLVHTGTGELHSYPFLRDTDLTCGPDVKHLGTLTLDILLEDPDDVVDPERFFEGTYSCSLDGEDVTPGDGAWQFRAQAEERVLSERVPVEAVCAVEERLEVPPATDWDWAEPEIAPAKVKVAKRDPAGFTVTNGVQPAKTPPPSEPEPTSGPTPEPTPETTTSESADPTPTPEPEPSSATDEPTEIPDETGFSMPHAPDQFQSSSAPDDDPVEADSESPRPPAEAAPLTTTAPYSLRGAFVWGPLLLLSVLVLRLRVPWRYRLLRRVAARRPSGR